MATLQQITQEKDLEEQNAYSQFYQYQSLLRIRVL